ncbi:hypothetical protein QWT69_10490 [Sporosarcina oncorhynchi]|uniref:Uncharacterized protein n=1 Tax=Sporosarcina oncorhynchi TaxID=3056444 RepID=A0ABZ0L415_9BACL|nr:hypothetical protein [Sporosarcina sp. T2O-4]WOV86367.1 hypothetical protein QWT69_10490 [Sporosarcina sp. T2O-4]
MSSSDKHKPHESDKGHEPKAEFTETEFTDEQRHTNEVASTAYQGSKKEKVDLKNDRLESGGF